MSVAKAAQSKVKHRVSKVETGSRLPQKVLTILPSMCQLSVLPVRIVLLWEKKRILYWFAVCMYTIPHRDARTSYCN